MGDTTADLPLAEIQGLILRGYRMNALRVVALEVTRPDAARAFLGSLVSGAASVPQLTTAAQWTSKPEACVNVAMTWDGLSALQLSAPVLASFPEAFVQGAVARAERVGDTGTSAPDTWDPAFASRRLHLLLVVFARDETIRERVYRELQAAWLAGGGCAELSSHDGGMLPGEVAHFGYRDGFAQPTIAGGLPPLLPDGVPAAPAGEFLLGYPSQYTDFTYPIPQEIGVNGSFVALRVLEQDCAGFETFLVEASRQTGLDPELIAAKLCGRWRGGAPLALAPTSPRPDLPIEQYNQFDYVPTPMAPDAVDDRRGYRCPIGAHVRRMNPRSSAVAGNSGLKRRIVRRGLPYGPPYDPANPHDGKRRGLLGLFIGVSLQDQFEFLMSDWANKGTFAPGLRDTRDPVLGDNAPNDATFLIPIEGQKAPLVVTGLSRFVTCRGAAYGFLPSVSALRRRATGA
jgi:deferrochelatase/peroxidase EfeB